MATQHPFGGPMTMNNANNANNALDNEIAVIFEESLQHMVETIYDSANPLPTRTRGSSEQQLLAKDLWNDVTILVKQELKQQQRGKDPLFFQNTSTNRENSFAVMTLSAAYSSNYPHLAGHPADHPFKPPDNTAVHPQYLLNLPRELLDKIVGNLSQRDLKSLRVTCSKLEEVANPVVFEHIHLSRAKKDRRLFFSVAAAPHLAMHVKQLTWFEMAEDENVFSEAALEHLRSDSPDIEYSDSILPELGGSLEHDITQTLPSLKDMASRLFWLPSTPHSTPHSTTRWSAPERERIDTRRIRIIARRVRIIKSWAKLFHRALDSMPKLNTFASRPMPAHHVLSEQDSAYEFVAYMFQKETLSDIANHQRNDGFFDFLLPAMKRSQCAVRHLHWADEAAGDFSSSVDRLRPEHGVAFRNLTSIDLCLSLRPSPPPEFFQWIYPFSAELTWFRLGKCLDFASNLTEITICFEKVTSKALRPKAFLEALDSCLFRPDGHWPRLTSLTLRDGPPGPSDWLAAPLAAFLKRHRLTLRRLTFQRWYVSQKLLRFCGDKRLPEMERIQIDNGDIDEHGASAAEPALLAFIRGDTDEMPLEDGAISCNMTIPAVEELIEKHHVSCWANPKFATVTKEMDFCAAVLQGSAVADNEGDENFEDMDYTDTSDSGTDYDLDVDSDAEFNHQSESGEGSGDL